MQYKILFVDDENANLRLLERLFRDEYDVYGAPSGADGLDLLAAHDFALIVSDQRMPAMSGNEFLLRASEMRPQTVRIMLTGYTDANALVEALNNGIVYKYITKPWNNDDFQQTVKRALQHYETVKAQRSLQLQNERLQSRIKATREGFIETLVDMLQLKDIHARSNAERVRDYAAQIGSAMRLDRVEIEQLMLAAFLHEAALFHIPSEISRKHAPHTDVEHRIVRDNLEAGLEIIARIPDLVEISSVLRYQFEHFDGTGQPNGFAGEQIPVHSRIIAVAAAYNCMTSSQVGAPRLSHHDAVEALISGAGTKFDPSVVAVFRASQLTPAAAEYDFELLDV